MGYFFIAGCLLALCAGQCAAFSPGETRSRDENHVCYEDYGCFYKNGTYSSFYALPVSPDEVGAKFYLTTSGAQTNPELLDYNNFTTLRASRFDIAKPIIIAIHGFGGGIHKDWPEPLRQAMFRGSPDGLNYIFVDWSLGAKKPNIFQAAANAQMAGAQIAKLIGSLNAVLGTKSSSFHIIGQSLGAQVAGFAGQRMQEYGHGRVAKITGTDPTGPLFEGSHTDARLSAGDADFVTGIHTNAVPWYKGGKGIDDRVGHIDFYPNGGQQQPGCPTFLEGLTSDKENAVCNHNRGLEYVGDSVNNPCAFVSYECDSYEDFLAGKCSEGENGVMGIFVDNKPAKKRHYLVTKDKVGFCAQQLKISLKLSQTSPSATGSLFITLIDKQGLEETVEQIADNQKLTPEWPVVRVIASRIKLTDLATVTVRYKPTVCLLFCSAAEDQLSVDGIEIGNLGAATRLCGASTVLAKDTTVTIPLENCRA